MKEQLIQWAEAGDGCCMFTLSNLYRKEGNTTEADKWLEKSVATKNFFAMKEYAARLREKGDVNAAVTLYKEIVKSTSDVEAMEAVVDMSEHDAENLNFVLNAINSEYNDIYSRDLVLERIITLGTRRHNELTIQTLQAIERRRIASRIRKLLADN